MKSPKHFWISFQYPRLRVPTRPPPCSWPLPTKLAPGDALHMVGGSTLHGQECMQAYLQMTTRHVLFIVCGHGTFPMVHSGPFSTTPASRQCRPLRIGQWVENSKHIRTSATRHLCTSATQHQLADQARGNHVFKENMRQQHRQKLHSFLTRGLGPGTLLLGLACPEQSSPHPTPELSFKALLTPIGNTYIFHQDRHRAQGAS